MVTLPFILFELFPFELCASQKYVSPLQGRETYCFSPGVRLSVRLSIRLSVTNPVRSIT